MSDFNLIKEKPSMPEASSKNKLIRFDRILMLIFGIFTVALGLNHLFGFGAVLILLGVIITASAALG